MTPFLTVLTPTYRRPVGLVACLESVWTQTAIDQIEQVVMVDHIGLGIGGM
jgi:glycosyltransferase involved in cell wall biosynthesis